MDAQLGKMLQGQMLQGQTLPGQQQNNQEQSEKQFTPFSVQVNARRTINVNNQSELGVGFGHLEYYSRTEGKVRHTCVDKCMDKLDVDELSKDEALCLEHCTQKM